MSKAWKELAKEEAHFSARGVVVVGILGFEILHEGIEGSILDFYLGH